MPSQLKIDYEVVPDSSALAAEAAERFTAAAERAVAARGIARIAISGGSTPKAAFALLADEAKPWRARMPWDKLELFWVDERCVPPDDADSNYHMTREALLDHVPLVPERVHRMEGEMEPHAAAERYEAALRTSFGIKDGEPPWFEPKKAGATPAIPEFDLVALGMGPDGHTASLFPHTTALNEMGRWVTANYVEKLSMWRVTLTWPVINRAREVFFLIGGADKAGVVSEVFTGANDPERLPSQLIWPANGILGVVLDAGAAARLPKPNASGRGVLGRTR